MKRFFLILITMAVILSICSCDRKKITDDKTEESKMTDNQTQARDDNLYPDNFKANANIILPHEAKGTVTYVNDDCHEAVAKIFEEMAEKYPSLKVTFAIITDRMAKIEIDSAGDYKMNEDGSYKIKTGSLLNGFWKKLLETGNGRFSFESHTHTHAPWGVDDSTDYGYPKNTVQKEVVGSKQILSEVFGQTSLAMIEPGTGSKFDYRAYFVEQVKKNYYGMRTTDKSAANTATYFKNANNRYNIGSYMIVDATEGVPTPGLVNKWKGYIDGKMSVGGWACFCIHYILPDGSKLNNQQVIYKSQADELFGYTESLGDSVWIATFGDAMKYYFEMSTAKISTELTENGISVSVTDNEPDEVFDYPLNVKVTIPDNWTNAYNGETELEIKDGTNGRYVCVSVIPNGEPTIIHR